MTVRVTDVKEHLWSKVMPEPNSGCWIWMGAIRDNGYGQTSFHGHHETAHRATYEAFVGPVPEGLELDHLCRVRCCVNPDHLEPVTHSENVRRGLTTMRARERKAAVVCPAGHAYDTENTYVTPDGARRCRACQKQREHCRIVARGGPPPREHNRHKTHCINGHPFDAENTYFRAGGHRGCRTCQRDAVNRSAAKRRSRAYK